MQTGPINDLLRRVLVQGCSLPTPTAVAGAPPPLHMLVAWSNHLVHRNNCMVAHAYARLVEAGRATSSCCGAHLSLTSTNPRPVRVSACSFVPCLTFALRNRPSSWTRLPCSFLVHAGQAQLRPLLLALVSAHCPVTVVGNVAPTRPSTATTAHPVTVTKATTHVDVDMDMPRALTSLHQRMMTS